MNKLSEIEPVALWNYFGEICKIPRPSKKEGKILEYIIQFAKNHNLGYKQDKTGNVVIHKPATPGKEKTETVILQSHVDMVGEKEQHVDHDFNRDPIHPFFDQGWVSTKGTTLGADDGIGIAAQLVILENSEIEHGPIECLFTVDEESGMTGASNLKPGFLEGKILINLDSEDEGELFIGCAGGIDTVARFPIKTEPVREKTKAYHIRVSGLQGGHSGDEIHKSPANAIKILNRFLWNADKEFKPGLNTFNGGNLRNAIPRDAEAVVVVGDKQGPDFETFFQVFAGTVKTELKDAEPNLTFGIKLADVPVSVINKKLQNRLFNALYSCPHGVITWNQDLEGLVETSTNLASIHFKEFKEIEVVTSQRSSVDSAKKDIADRINSVFTLADARIEHSGGYPGWTPNRDSEILRITQSSYKRLFRKNPLVRVIHAGLECGLILEKYPDLDMISFGPTIKGAHTPGEKINVRSTQKFWKLLLDVLRNIPES